jgi:FtsH-binding integral membrane protein
VKPRALVALSLVAIVPVLAGLVVWFWCAISPSAQTCGGNAVVFFVLLVPLGWLLAGVAYAVVRARSTPL